MRRNRLSLKDFGDLDLGRTGIIKIQPGERRTKVSIFASDCYILWLGGSLARIMDLERNTSDFLCCVWLYSVYLYPRTEIWLIIK